MVWIHKLNLRQTSMDTKFGLQKDSEWAAGRHLFLLLKLL